MSGDSNADMARGGWFILSRVCILVKVVRCAACGVRRAAREGRWL